ncbi:MAG: hypothetical protein V4662_17765 [Verrucomicrobiota bacterium]
MLFTIAQLITDPDTTAVITPAVGTWIAGALGAFALFEKLAKIFGWGPKEQRQITGTLDTKPAHQPADKAELEAVKQSIAALSEKLDNKVGTLMQAGAQRAEVITQKIDADIRTTRVDIDLRLASMQKEINDAGKKDATHDEAIETLKLNNLGHGNRIAQILQRLPKGSNIP